MALLWSGWDRVPGPGSRVTGGSLDAEEVEGIEEEVVGVLRRRGRRRHRLLRREVRGTVTRRRGPGAVQVAERRRHTAEAGAPVGHRTGHAGPRLHARLPGLQTGPRLKPPILLTHSSPQY